MTKNGQVALIVLLISAVVMTIGLSVSKKTVVNTKIETNQEQLKQAFNAAESGLDYYFGTGSTKFVAIDNNSTADIMVKNIGSTSVIGFDQFVMANGNVNYWLVSHSDNGDINYLSYFKGTGVAFCFSNLLTLGGIEFDYYYLSGTNYLVKRIGYNFSTDAIPGFTNFATPPTQTSCASGYKYVNLSTSLPLAGVTPLILTAKMINTSGKIYLMGGGDTFPVQGIIVNSVGRVGDVSTGGTNVNRSLEVKRTYQVPGFAFEGITAFDNVLSN